MGPSGFELIAAGDGRYELVGELDMARADRFADEVKAVTGDDVILDLRGLRFIDSAGVRALLRIAAAVEPGMLRIEGVGDSVEIVLGLVRMKDVPNVIVTSG